MPLQYVGRSPGSDTILSPKSYADSQAAAKVVTNSFVNSTTAAQAPNLVLTSSGYVATQDNLRAKKTNVTSADAAYLAATARNAAGGVAGLSAGGFVDPAQLPTTMSTERAIKSYSVTRAAADRGLLGALASSATAIGTVYLGSSSTRQVTTTQAREYRLASISVPDPGYAWRPLPFAFVEGGSVEADDPGTRSQGTGSYGLLTVMPPAGSGNQIYASGIGTGSFAYDFIPVLPFAASNQTPTTVPPIPGALQLDLYGCCWAGDNYTFTGYYLSYWILVVPAL